MQMNRRTMLLGVGALSPLIAGMPAVLAGTNEVSGDGQKPLWRLAADHGVEVGAALNGWIFSDPIARAVFEREFSAAVCEGAMKIRAIAPDRPEPDFREADPYVRLVSQLGKRIRGHTLLWHWYVPPWLLAASANNDSGPIRAYVGQVVGHFGQSVFGWDVVNELLSNNPGEYLRDSPITPNGSLAFAIEAFKAARTASPTSKLAINEYFFSLPREAAFGKVINFTRLFRKLEQGGAEIDVVGVQAHLHVENAYAVNDYAKVFEEIAKLRKPVVITELDFSDRYSLMNASVEDQRVSDELEKFLAALNGVFGKVPIYSWGILDKYSWINNPAYSSNSISQRPLLFDDFGKGKAPLRALRRYYGGD